MLVEGLQTVLETNAAVQALLRLPADRKDGTNGLFPVLAIESPTMPYVVYSQATGNPLQESMQGTGRLQTVRWRFSCYGSTYKQGKKLAEALREALLPLFGVIAGPANVYVEGSWLKLEADDAEPLMHGILYSSHVDFEFNFLDLH